MTATTASVGNVLGAAAMPRPRPAVREQRMMQAGRPPNR